jgi:hypothetical protein
MSNIVRIILRRAIALENPRWTLEQIGYAIGEALDGRGPYAILLADLQVACEP